MQKSSILITLIAVLTSVSIFKLSNISAIKQSDMISPEIGAEVHQKFEEYLVEYKKIYTPEEKIYRLAIFYKNFMEVITQNKKKSTWKAGLNMMSDMTQKEIDIKYSTVYPDVAPTPSEKITKK
jgi:Cathepsin propeptide inhibitor domain (I29)